MEDQGVGVRKGRVTREKECGSISEQMDYWTSRQVDREMQVSHPAQHIEHSTVQYNTAKYITCTVQYSIVQYNTAKYMTCTVQYSTCTVQCSTHAVQYRPSQRNKHSITQHTCLDEGPLFVEGHHHGCPLERDREGQQRGPYLSRNLEKTIQWFLFFP